MQVMQLQREYEALREALLFVRTSERRQLQLILAWLTKVFAEHPPATVKSYARELMDVFATAADRAEPDGCAPEFFRDLRLLFDRVLAELPDVVPESFIEPVRRALQEKEQTVRGWLGYGSDGHAASSTTQGERGALDPKHERHRDALLSTSQSGSGRDNPVSRTRREKENAAPAVLVPLLEQDTSESWLSGVHGFGYVSELRISIRNRAPEAKEDSVVFDNVVIGERESEARAQAAAVLDMVRALGPALVPFYRKTRYELRLQFPAMPATLSGQSFGLALAVGIITALSRDLSYTTYYALQAGCAFSGAVSRDGTLLALPDEIVDQKVRAVFYSPCSTLVIPKDNEARAESALAGLLAEHGSRELALVPVRDITDVFDHRRVIRTERFGLWQRTLKLVRKHQTQIALASSTLLVLLLALYFLVLADFDSNPATVYLKDSHYEVLNKNGKLLWRISALVSNGSHRGHVPAILKTERTVVERTAVYDLDGDGSNEVLLAPYGLQAGESDIVTCYNADMSVRWHARVGQPTITAEADFTDAPIQVLRIWAGRLKQRRDAVVLVGSANMAYSNFLTQLNAAGMREQEYMHAGVIMSWYIVPWGENGEDRILFSGKHNGFLAPVTGLLDPLHLDGVCPEEASHRLLQPALPRARELVYLRFPESVATAAVPDEADPVATIQTCDSAGAVVIVREIQMPPIMLTYKRDDAFLLYRIDRTLRVTAVNSSNGFDTLLRYFHRLGRLSDEQVRNPMQRLGERLELWDGTRFVRRDTKAG